MPFSPLKRRQRRQRQRSPHPFNSYVARTGIVTVDCRSVDSHTQIDVRDTGPGVPVSMRGEIFKPFRSFKDYGTGIGLAFSRKVSQAHDGSIELVASDEGACFRIELPVTTIKPRILS